MKLLHFVLIFFFMYACCRVDNQEGANGLEHPTLKRPEPIYIPSIELPDSLRRKGVLGTVYVKCIIDTFGHVKKAKILKTNNERLNGIALKIAKKYKFSPAEQNGKKINFIVVIPINFKPNYK